MNWVVSWVDVSIYPVWTAWYLSYFVPALKNGATIGGVEFSSDSLLAGSCRIDRTISYLNFRGAKLTALTASWLGVLMIIPLIIMSGFGIYAWIVNGTPTNIPFLPSASSLPG